MKIIVSNIIQIIEPTVQIRNYCKQNLIFKNPTYEKKRRMGFYLLKTPKYLYLYEEYENNLYLPIGTFNDIWNLHPYKEDYTELSNTVPINIKSKIKLRDYQIPCIQAIKKYINGILIMPCGTGKTETALQIIYELQQKTLWITHTIDLLNQAKDRCDSKMECKTSIIAEGSFDLSGDIVFATVQTLHNFVLKQDIPQNTFGMLIVDEVHRVLISAESIGMFEKCISYFASRYKFGMTANLHRADGLEKCIPLILGNVLYEMKKEKDYFVGYYENKEVCRVESNKFQIPVTVKVILTYYSLIRQEEYEHNTVPYIIEERNVFDEDGAIISFSNLISVLATNVKRNEIILNILKSEKSTTLILSDRIEQLKYLQGKTPNSAILIGSTKKSDREKIIDSVKEGKVKYFFATYSLVKEGLDIPRLGALIMGTPVKDKSVVIQSLGRIQRPFENKTEAICYDLLDNVSMLYGFYTKRKTIYTKEKYLIKEEEI